MASWTYRRMFCRPWTACDSCMQHMVYVHAYFGPTGMTGQHTGQHTRNCGQTVAAVVAVRAPRRGRGISLHLEHAWGAVAPEAAPPEPRSLKDSFAGPFSRAGVLRWFFKGGTARRDGAALGLPVACAHLKRCIELHKRTCLCCCAARQMCTCNWPQAQRPLMMGLLAGVKSVC